MNNRSRFIIQKHIVGGVLSGILLITISIVSDLVIANLSVAEVLKLHINSITHIIIYLSPLLLGLYGYLTSKFYNAEINNLKSAFDEEKNRTKKINEFIQELIKGQTDTEYELTSKDDLLGQSLIELQDNIKKNKEEEEIRKKEDIQRSWVNEGLAKFGEILRHDTDNLEALSYNIIHNLVKYLDANQGGFFIINDDDPKDKHFDMTTCYAYERKKFADRRVNWGEGLIGTCAIEKETIYLEEIPETYVNITSGLGKATPNAILIVPIKLNEDIYGVLELASFKKMQKYEIEFVEKVAESIASTISNVKINEKTARLLEESREQAEAMAKNEEQLKQNMEELQAAQEEAARQSEQFIEFNNTVNHTLLRAEYSAEGVLQYANTKFLHKLGYKSNSEVEGKNISMFINEKDKDWFFKLWDKLTQGGKHYEGNMKHMTKNGNDLWTMATYTSMKKPDNTVDKILFLGLDITEQKQHSLDMEGQLDALERSGIKAEFSLDGDFLDCNRNFLATLGYNTISEIEEKKIFDFVDKVEAKEFNINWKNIQSNENYEGIIKFVNKDKETRWFRLSLSAVKDIYDEISKVILIAQDITSEKMMEIENQKQTEKLIQKEEKLIASEKELTQRLNNVKDNLNDKNKKLEEIIKFHHAIINNIQEAVLTIGHDGSIKHFNQSAEELLNYQQKEVIGQKADFIFTDDAIKKSELVKQFLDPSKKKTIDSIQEVQLKAKNNKPVSALIKITEINTTDFAYAAIISEK